MDLRLLEPCFQISLGFWGLGVGKGYLKKELVSLGIELAKRLDWLLTSWDHICKTRCFRKDQVEAPNLKKYLKLIDPDLSRENQV